MHDLGGERVGSPELASILDAGSERVVDLWERLGADGPTCGSPDAGSVAEARERYLVPLARTLIGAIAGSPDHAAIYLDERLRYAPAVDGVRRRAHFASALNAELPGFLELIEDPKQRSELSDLWRTLHAPLTEDEQPSCKLLFIGDCLFVETRAFLGPMARRAGRPLDVRQVFFSANQGLGSVNESVLEEIRRYTPDIIGISLFSFEGVPPYTAAWRAAGRPLPRQKFGPVVQGLTDLVGQLLTDIRKVSDATVVLHAPGGLPLDPVRRRVPMLSPHSRNQARFLCELGSSVAELAAATPNTVLLDERQLVGSQGRIRELNGPVFDPADVPVGYAHTTRFGPVVARAYDDVASAYSIFGRAKALLVDFDNTLWSGVMAEGAVVHHHPAQRLLLELKDAGVLLVALSKNDPAAIRWDEMILKPQDFVALKINWSPKPDNTRQVIKELNLGASAFVLIDDNPVERALVSEQVPGVRAVDPTDPRTWESLRRWLSFPSTTQTEEARRRTDMYREAAERRSAMDDSLDYPAMMQSLKLRCVVRQARSSDRDRLLELIQRTNQFNTSTKRRSAPEVEGLLGSDRFGTYVLELRDRFGDLGVVALAIFDRLDSSFDSVIMSCRAMGFGVETALLRIVMDAEAAGDVKGIFVPTERNGPAAGLFRSAGFTEVAPNEFQLGADDVRPEVPSWLDMKVPVG